MSDSLSSEPPVLKTEGFTELIHCARAGDSDAETRLVRYLEPHIHRAARVPIRNFRLHRTLDTNDISQAVLANLFRRRLLVRMEITTPIQLIRLVTRMTRNKVLDEVRRSQADCRDQRRIVGQTAAQLAEANATKEPTPSKVVAMVELMREIYRRLSEEERRLAQLRADGLDWISIAEQQGATPDAVRKRLTRAMERVSHEMGLEPLLVP
jgi:RNA polymerase sigma factor (sigma-70 family)